MIQLFGIFRLLWLMSAVSLSAKPIDLLAKYVTAEEDEMDMDIEMNEPYTILNVCCPTFWSYECDHCRWLLCRDCQAMIWMTCLKTSKFIWTLNRGDTLTTGR